MEDVSNLVQMSLTARAFIYFALFTFAGYLVLKSNDRELIAVTLFGWFLIVAGLFNLLMVFEWLSLFYL